MDNTYTLTIRGLSGLYFEAEYQKNIRFLQMVNVIQNLLYKKVNLDI